MQPVGNIEKGLETVMGNETVASVRKLNKTVSIRRPQAALPPGNAPAPDTKKMLGSIKDAIRQMLDNPILSDETVEVIENALENDLPGVIKELQIADPSFWARFGNLKKQGEFNVLVVPNKLEKGFVEILYNKGHGRQVSFSINAYDFVTLYFNSKAEIPEILKMVASAKGLLSDLAEEKSSLKIIITTLGNKCFGVEKGAENLKLVYDALSVNKSSEEFILLEKCIRDIFGTTVFDENFPFPEKGFDCVGEKLSDLEIERFKGSHENLKVGDLVLVQRSGGYTQHALVIKIEKDEIQLYDGAVFIGKNPSIVFKSKLPELRFQ